MIMKTWHKFASVIGAIAVSATLAYAAQVINDDLTVNGNVTFAGQTFTVNSAVTPTFNAAIVPVGGVAAGGGFSFAPNIAACAKPATLSTDGTDTTPAVTETFVAQFHIPSNATITGLSVFNGSAVAGNMTVSLADSTGAPIAAAKSATTAQAGVDTYQRVSFAAPYAAKGPATYYGLVQFDNTGARLNTILFGDNCRTTKQTGQVYGTFTSFTPPTTFTASVGPYMSTF